ncbi:APC family permease [Spiroplasma chrysopicola]|uniref:Amino acid permease n=1 Tax=Spiroplasma chrysopicola DF-1 TaxID=1276227 RepID=R4UAD8_9MOLU|nr:APC family permease [Spiroplasma chrysopicola]AGM24879.1 amino acid permease [Spiroplasma chrysopicola DF-1]
MHKTTAKKYGFFMCLSMAIGTIIGTGIFFKNEAVYGFTNGNGILGLIAWLIGGIMAVSFGLSFMEISSAKQDSNSGVSLYAKIFGGKRFGHVVRSAMNHVYLPITAAVIAYYTTKASIWAFGGGLVAEEIFKAKVGGHLNYELILATFSILYSLLLVYICSYQEKVGKWIQIVTVILKVFPLIIIGLIGLFFINNDPNAFSESGLGDQSKYPLVAGKSGFEMILMAMPGILFAFDGFLATTYIQKDVVKPEKNIPLALVVGLTAVTVLYLLVSIGTLNLDASGSVAAAAGKIFNSPLANKIFERIIFFFIFISAFGALNGYHFSLTKLSRSSIEDNFGFFGKKANKLATKTSFERATFLYAMVITLFWAIVMAVPTIFTDLDFYGFISDAGVVLAFLMYGSIIGLGLYNRYTKKVSSHQYWYFIPTAIISTICIAFIMGYNIYSYFLNAIETGASAGPIIRISLLLFILICPWSGWWMNEGLSSVIIPITKIENNTTAVQKTGSVNDQGEESTDKQQRIKQRK